MVSPYESTLVEIETAIAAINVTLDALEEWKNGMRRASANVPGGATLSFNVASLNSTLRELRDNIENAVATVPVEV